MSQKLLIIIGIILAIILGTILVVRVFTPEDTWLCRRGDWVRHGNPSTMMPSEPCSS